MVHAGYILINSGDEPDAFSAAWDLPRIAGLVAGGDMPRVVAAYRWAVGATTRDVTDDLRVLVRDLVAERECSAADDDWSLPSQLPRILTSADCDHIEACVAETLSDAADWARQTRPYSYR